MSSINCFGIEKVLTWSWSHLTSLTALTHRSCCLLLWCLLFGLTSIVCGRCCTTFSFYLHQGMSNEANIIFFVRNTFHSACASWGDLGHELVRENFTKVIKLKWKLFGLNLSNFTYLVDDASWFNIPFFNGSLLCSFTQIRQMYFHNITKVPLHIYSDDSAVGFGVANRVSS